MNDRAELVAKVYVAMEQVDEHCCDFGLIDEDYERMARAAVAELVGHPPVEALDGRPIYILAIRAQALDDVQELIEAIGDRSQPTAEQWELLKELAFPPPPMAGGGE